jgi:two-component system CheB/CheR fusion protein
VTLTPAQRRETDRCIFREANDAFVIIRPDDQQVVDVNPAAQRLTGLRRKQLLRMNLADLLEGARPGALAELAHACQTTGYFAPADGYCLKAAGGRRRAAQVSASRIHTEPEALGLVVIRDVSGQKQAEEALREKDDFLAMLGHELRNPVAAVLSAVERLRLRGPSDPVTQGAAERIGRQVRHLTRLLDDLLDATRVRRGTIKLRRESLELAAVVAQAVDTIRPLVDARKQRLTVSLPPEPVWLEADLTRLVQVLSNLLHNAAKYTPEGGHIALAAERKGGQVVFQVRDSGKGIPAELLPRVFDLFRQGEQSLARPEGGLGIGLTLVKGLVELHGGSVQALSDGPGKGSLFVVRLPAWQEAPRGPSLAGGREEGRRPPEARRILLVEDHRDIAEEFALLFQDLGHEVRVAHDGPAALEVARTFRPELVLLDIGLPCMDGWEVARRMRELPGMGDPVLAAMTGYAQEEDRRRSSEAGIDYHLVKPVELIDLLELIAGLGPPVPRPSPG